MRLTKRNLALAAVVSFTALSSLSWTSAGFAKSHSFKTSPANLLQSIKRQVAAMEGPDTVWTGPTTGPKAAKGKFIVYLSGMAGNNLSRDYGIFMAQAAAKIGWKFKVINASGSASSWLNGLNEAIALKPNGIAMFANAATLQGPIRKAVARGIVLIGLHASAEPGPRPTRHLFTNIESSPAQIGRAEADYVIANSNGKANVVVLTHNEYAIAYTKSMATKNQLTALPGIHVKGYVNVPAANSQQLVPGLVTSWVQRYGLPLYATTVGDTDWAFAAAALRGMGVQPSQVRLVGSDGTPGAYARIRQGNDYQVATVPEPVELQAWQAIDEFNRAFHKMPPSNFLQPVHLVVHSNVNLEGGRQGFFNPANHYKQHYEKIWGVK